MYYVLDGVRWGHQDRITHVRWHPVEVVGERLEHGPAELVEVVEAGRACEDHEVRVYLPGNVGEFFKMKACPGGIDEETANGTPLADRLAHLPTV